MFAGASAFNQAEGGRFGAGGCRQSEWQRELGGQEAHKLKMHVITIYEACICNILLLYIH